MNAFEELVAGLLRRDGYWIHHSYKIALTKAEKKSIGKPSLPRIEIDLLAYRATTNSLPWVECKSYLDSTGVKTSDFDKVDGRYKVFGGRSGVYGTQDALAHRAATPVKGARDAMRLLMSSSNLGAGGLSFLEG